MKETNGKLVLNVVGAGVFAACATGIHVDAPRTLMHRRVEASWTDRSTGSASWNGNPVDCTGPFTAFATGREPVSFELGLVKHSEHGDDAKIRAATLWLREPYFDRVQRFDVTEHAADVSEWDAVSERFEHKETRQLVGDLLPITVRLKTSTYPKCRNGEVVESVGIYPYVGLVRVAGCSDKVFLIDEHWIGEQIVVVECGGTSPNTRINAAVPTVTARAVARSAPVRPARYAQR